MRLRNRGMSLKVGGLSRIYPTARLFCNPRKDRTNIRIRRIVR